MPDQNNNPLYLPATPDPSVQTREALSRDIEALRELLTQRVDCNREVLEARLSGYDEAIKLLQTIADRIPQEMDGKVSQALQLVNERFLTITERLNSTDQQALRSQELRNEKFSSVQLQFHERDTRSERESRDNKVAVDAAFAAQKEAASEQNKSNTLAIDKSERATAETLNKQADLFKATTDGQARELAEVKDRLTRMESEKRGSQVSNAFILTCVGIAIALAGVVSAIVSRLT